MEMPNMIRQIVLSQFASVVDYFVTDEVQGKTLACVMERNCLTDYMLAYT